ncbi:hypothetical protein [Mycobacterium sp. DBP42]|uniref:hypothetical protein n=1 Tax=Mycobacterium sp. DBP42 TaxID=2545267 RepID=UPI0020173B8F|nr:hypothetical protein [Mycobacterium sp. DBP42]
MTKFRHGLMIGKFYPPRLGHHEAIRAAAARCDRFTVLVMAAAVETIPLADRMAWLREEHERDANVRIAGIPCDAPVDVTDERVWAAQVAAMRAGVRAAGAAPDIDAVFSGDDYVDELARWFGATAVRTGRTREQHCGAYRSRGPLARVGSGHPGRIDHTRRGGGGRVDGDDDGGRTVGPSLCRARRGVGRHAMRAGVRARVHRS